MTDPELLAKKLAFVETCVAELKRLANPAIIDTDIREERFVEHTLQLAIQAAQDVASHIVSDERLGEPRTNRELFDLLGRNEWLDQSQAALLSDMVGFRNILVHGYADVNLSVVRDVLENHLDDLLKFVAVVRARMP
ncbi:MAG: DUF86 domain-containing protein [Thermoanaerobaculales bacterium]|nr:DUF86 domain-containing protein [Thermoanaerobaculales bacterium]